MESLLRSLRDLGSHFSEAALLRGRLASLEWAQERERLVALILWTLAAAFLLAMAVIVGTFAIAALFWETHRMLALGLIAGGYAVLGFGTLLALVRYLRTAPPLLHQTLNVFQEDAQCRFSAPARTSRN
jgi:uncharacterized membrane protein YqjE